MTASVTQHPPAEQISSFMPVFKHFKDQNLPSAHDFSTPIVSTTTAPTVPTSIANAHRAAAPYGNNRSAAPRTLAVFDVDGTLLVTEGREIVCDSNGMRAAVHPLMEPHVTDVLKDYTSDYSHSGEEDQNDDVYELIKSACIIEPIAEMCRQFMLEGNCNVAIISARGHHPDWLATQLEEKLNLPHPLPPDFVKCVYSKPFDESYSQNKGADGTSDRKAYALAELINETRPEVIHFFDDVQSNIDGAMDFIGKAHPDMTLHTHMVPFSMSVDACIAHGVDICELLHFQCRDEHAPNPLVEELVKLPTSQMRGLHAWEARSKERCARRPLPP